MISHVYVGVENFERALVFYSAVMDTLDMQIKFAEPTKSWAGWTAPGQPRPLFVVGRPFNGQHAAPGNGQMVALLAHSRAAVDAAYAVALEQGGSSEGEPGLRPHYHPNFYGAYFRDLDGNKLCICCHD
ncbi:VOC family protein [Massilia sp. PAMC28688]|uniref:VOC family protein n=1 Tax=Massilia sp. PAMC28688 TaxID=2861283 RepID=UPI001C62EA01|nr:VOC family protein [Massilia sp. PAMC28688]QYF93728.1 VOC family protein [Massilia sp. PAMC28688]